jgi:hypothetical protein
MSRLSAWLAIAAMAAIAAVMLGGSAWAWAQVQADVVLSMRSGSLGGPNFDGLPTQSVLLPFLCHW